MHPGWTQLSGPVNQRPKSLSLRRERAAGYYAAYPFAAAQALIELPYLLCQAILFWCAPGRGLR